MSEFIKCLICDEELQKTKHFFDSGETRYMFCSKRCSDVFDSHFSKAKFIEGCRHGVVMLSEPLQNNMALLVESVLMKISGVNEVTVTPDSILISYSMVLSVLGGDESGVLLLKKAQHQQVLLMKSLFLDVELAIKDGWFERMPKQFLKREVES